MPRHRDQQFILPQPVQVEIEAEQNYEPGVMSVLRQLASLGVADHENLKRVRNEVQEIHMRISELSSKLDTLISVATSIKDTAGSQPAASIPEDDPEIAVMAKKIDDAIAVLQGVSTSNTGTVASPSIDPTTGLPLDPNAPV